MNIELGPTKLPGRGRDLFISDEIHECSVEGVDGWCIQMALTSYRSLPLSCIDALEVEVDGVLIDASELRLILGEQVFSPSEFSGLRDNWWFILDTAYVWFPSRYATAGRDHEIKGKIIKVEPYISNGRWHFTSVSKRTMKVMSQHAWRNQYS